MNSPSQKYRVVGLFGFGSEDSNLGRGYSRRLLWFLLLDFLYVVTASICMEVRGQLYESVLSFQREIRGSKSGSRACIVTAFSLCTISLLLQTP